MSKYVGFKKESKVRNLMSKLCLNVFAEEDPEKKDTSKEDLDKKKDVTEEKGATDTNTNKDNKSTENKDDKKSPTINFEDLISKARKEEKEKLYPRIKTLEGKVADLTEKNNNHLLTIEGLNTKVKELEGNRDKSETETVKILRDKISSLEKELESNKEESNKVNVEEIENKIKEEYEVKLYRLEKIHAEDGNIIPELVTGTTKEEVDKSLEFSKERFKQIQENIMKTNNVTPNKVPSANVDTNKFNVKDISIQDISQMDPRSPEYKEIRKKLGLR